MILTVLQTLSLTIMTANFSPGCIIPPIPDMADIVLETVEYHGEINGRVDFVGMQRITHNYHRWPLEPISGEREVLSLFMSKLDAGLREKIHVTQSSSEGFPPFPACLTPWWWGPYKQFFLGHQKPVNDSLSLFSCLYTENFKAGNNKMTGIALSEIKRYSHADYFLVIAVKLLNANKFNNRRKANVALLTVIYNMDGKKIYSKIYEETLDIIQINPRALSDDSFSYYNCTMKIIENQGEQISNDLMFLLAADDAPSPTLEDLHNRLQQPGTIHDDVEYLKGFQNK